MRSRDVDRKSNTAVMFDRNMTDCFINDILCRMYVTITIFLLCLSQALLLQPVPLILVFTWGRLLQRLRFLLFLSSLLSFLLFALLFVCQVIKAFFIQLQVVAFGEKERIFLLGLRSVHHAADNKFLTVYAVFILEIIGSHIFNIHFFLVHSWWVGKTGTWWSYLKWELHCWANNRAGRGSKMVDQFHTLL